jgi:cell division protein FtsW
MGTAALIGLVLFLMIFSSGARKLHIFLCAIFVMPAGAVYVCSHLDYVLKRIYAWLEGGSTGKAYHAYMSTQSMASGGLTGVGPGKGWAKLWYLPEAHTDFIFAVAGQEFGLVGTIGIVLAFMVIAYCGIKIIRLVNDTFASQLAFGITMLICLQAAFNIAVVTATTPTKGISLPFVSFGGSGLVCSMFAIGVMASVTRNAFRPQLQLIKGKASDSAWSAHILRAA